MVPGTKHGKGIAIYSSRRYCIYTTPLSSNHNCLIALSPAVCLHSPLIKSCTADATRHNFKLLWRCSQGPSQGHSRANVKIPNFECFTTLVRSLGRVVRRGDEVGSISNQLRGSQYLIQNNRGGLLDEAFWETFVLCKVDN